VILKRINENAVQSGGGSFDDQMKHLKYTYQLIQQDVNDIHRLTGHNVDQLQGELRLLFGCFSNCVENLSKKANTLEKQMVDVQVESERSKTKERLIALEMKLNLAETKVKLSEENKLNGDLLVSLVKVCEQEEIPINFSPVIL
jgi:hypothetical protein